MVFAPAVNNETPVVHGATANTKSPASRSRAVGLIDPHYGLEHVSYGLDVPGYSFQKIGRVPIHRFERRGTFWAYTPIIWDRSVSLLHTFNMIPLNAKRFVMSFEIELPRYLGAVRRWQEQTGYRILASTSCGAILPLSDVACQQAKQKFDGLGLTEVSKKIRTFRGAIRPSKNVAIRDRSAKTPLRLLFVGRNAFRKGLLPVLDALEELRNGGVEVELTLVSSLDLSDDYIYSQDNVSVAETQHRLSQLSWVTHHRSVPNDAVRELMHCHDLFILPTFDESLGWVIAEAGMEGCPSITTDIFAIPEMVDDEESGFLLSLPKGNDQRWSGLHVGGDERRDLLEQARRSLCDQIVQRIGGLVGSREKLCKMAEASRKKMQCLFNRETAALNLKQIYDDVLS